METLKAKWTLEDVEIGSILIKDDDREKYDRVIGIINDKIIHTVNQKGIEFSGQDYYYRNLNYKLLVNESIGKPYNENDLLSITDSENIQEKELFNNTFKSDLQFKLEYLKELNRTFELHTNIELIILADRSEFIKDIINASHELIKEISELQK